MTTSAIPLFRAEAWHPKGAQRLAWTVLIYNVAVILWGTIVRATGSGAGCGEHWPLCNGTVIQHSPRIETIIEFTHRAMSGVALIAILVLLVWTFAATAKRHLARVSVVAAAVLTFNEALLGALLVLLGKVAHDQSASRAVYLSLHLANTLLLLAALGLTAQFLSRTAGFMRGSVEYRSVGIALVGLLAMLFVGVSGSLAALGDTLFPATSLRSALAEDFSAKSAWLLRIRWVHPALGFIAGAFICWLIFTSAWKGRNRKLAIGVVVLLGIQYALGFADIALLAPTWMQIVHLLGADTLWIALVVLAARVCLVPIGCPDNQCRA
ncbi:COX15/CtaA family protein [Alloacidobacterium sp.]|uniref:COX15/CtaA family protein n=1 Tax=Alloacidobacterium sp. TaxID=2951999 RepID=UPI002D5B86E8|nr:COX15/CtaA family protein [Alloacidobacterium sp.]HYK36906.1 COX15/CtaA family protein [Alloacidobacterium sp.]